MCTYDKDVLVETCWDSSLLGCAVNDPACEVHNHHTPCNRAWGKTWTLDRETLDSIEQIAYYSAIEDWLNTGDK